MEHRAFEGVAGLVSEESSERRGESVEQDLLLTIPEPSDDVFEAICLSRQTGDMIE